MKQIICLLTILPACIFSVSAQTLQSVTTTAGSNSTTNLLRTTGANNVPSTGKGLEVYFNGSQGVLSTYDRDNSQALRLRLQPGTQSVTTINDGGGRLLINTGTDDGATPLQLTGNMRVQNGTFRLVSTGGTTPHGTQIYNDENFGGRSILLMDANGGDFGGVDYFSIQHYTGNTGTLVGNANAAPLKFSTSAIERMRIDADGKVVIGMGIPQADAKLTVDGNVVAKKVKVTASIWADHVFQPGYRLPTLQELEAYIQRHRHLPDVPSETEIKRNGIDMGENQAKLLQKIEELTLYIIELNKKVERQEKELEKLKSRKD